MTTPDIAEARRLAEQLKERFGATVPTSQAAAMLHALAAEVERLRAQVAPAEALLNAATLDWPSSPATRRKVLEAADTLRRSLVATAAGNVATPEQTSGSSAAAPVAGQSLTVGERAEPCISTKPDAARPHRPDDFCPDMRCGLVGGCVRAPAQPAAQAEPVAPTWQPVTDADLANAEAFIMKTGARGHIIPADLFTLRNITAHMIREVRAARVSQPPAQGVELPPLPEPDFSGDAVIEHGLYSADQMHAYARAAIAQAPAATPTAQTAQEGQKT